MAHKTEAEFEEAITANGIEVEDFDCPDCGGNEFYVVGDDEDHYFCANGFGDSTGCGWSE